MSIVASRETSAGCAIKLLDQLTNRYHVGIVRSAARDSLIIDMPATARLRSGQQIKFVLADDAGGIVERCAMRTAVIGQVLGDPYIVRMSLNLGAEVAAA